MTPEVIKKQQEITICLTANLSEPQKKRLVEVANNALGYTGDPKLAFDQSLINHRVKGSCLMVCESGKPLGFALADTVQIESKKVTYLSFIAVDNDFQEEGLGTELMKRIISMAGENGCSALIWRTQNPRLLKAIEKASPSSSVIPLTNIPTQNERNLMDKFILNVLIPGPGQTFNQESWIFKGVSPRRGDMGKLQHPINNRSRTEEINSRLTELGLTPEEREAGHSMMFMINFQQGKI